MAKCKATSNESQVRLARDHSKPAGAYIQNAVTPVRIAQAKQRIDRVPWPVVQRFGVPSEILVGVWAQESAFGQVQGDYDVIRSLATLAYDGRREMAEAFRRAQEEAEIKNSKLKKYLWTKDLPPVDLVIRTGGNPHWSAGFLMWHTADSEFYFTKTFWPAFSTKEFKAATEEYLRRPRNLGA